MRPALHFVGFKGDEYTSAVKIWGVPDFIHLGNDFRLRNEIAPGDTVIYANGYDLTPVDHNYPDTSEILPI